MVRFPSIASESSLLRCEAVAPVTVIELCASSSIATLLPMSVSATEVPSSSYCSSSSPPMPPARRGDAAGVRACASPAGGVSAASGPPPAPPPPPRGGDASILVRACGCGCGGSGVGGWAGWEGGPLPASWLVVSLSRRGSRFKGDHELLLRGWTLFYVTGWRNSPSLVLAP